MKFLKTALILAGVFGASQAMADDADLFASPSVLTQTTGDAIYHAVCVACHQEGGVGAAGAGHYPALANNEMLAGADYPIYVIVNGQKAMPPLKSILNDAQIAEVTNYIRTSFGNNFTDEPATAEQVAEARN